MARLWLIMALLVGGPACSRRSPASDGVIVRQVLRGADVFQDAAPDAPAAPEQPRGPQLGQVSATLVADSPQATYKRALDGARKQLETDSARAALSRLESQIEQEQESPP